MAETFTSTFLNNFLLIFVAIDPFALIPIFAGITHGLKKNEIKRIYLRATIISFIILFFFSLLGQSLLNVMGININSFKIIGGLFLIFIAFEMVFEKRDERRQNLADSAIDEASAISLATFPLAIPLIAGPGSITITMLIAEKSGPELVSKMINFLPVMLSVILAGICMWLSSKLVEIISISLLSVIQRVFGLLLGALAIEYVISGIKNIFGLS
ncbi:MAG: MarC family protein [Candidatus Neomarinimicrobiota bacterium]|jgi:multiple antibiotic resistance protein|tara:strand:- start:1590 stop:2231 length:642 start_codon:yes stop_codon:yes gene_type:complete